MTEYLTPKQRRALNNGHTRIANTGSNNIGGVQVNFHGKSSITSGDYLHQRDQQRAEQRAASSHQPKRIHHSEPRPERSGQEENGPVTYDHVLRMWEALQPEAQTRKTGHSDAEYGGEYEQTADRRHDAIQNATADQPGSINKPQRRPHSIQGGGPTHRVGHAVDTSIDRARRRASRDSLQDKARQASRDREAGEVFESLVNRKSK